MCLVEIVQNMRQTGEIPQDFGCTVLVLIHKGTIDTQGIGFVETLWKVVKALIDMRLRASLQFHDALHGFWDGRGTGTYIMELKLTQDLPIVDHDPLFLVLLGLWKAYDTVDGERLV